jgi:hypothetical protein
MKMLCFGIISLGLMMVSVTTAIESESRLTKKEKEELEHISSDPILSIKKSIGVLNQIAEQIQNFVLSLTVNEGQHSKECCDKVLARIDQFELLIAQILQELVNHLEKEHNESQHCCHKTLKRLDDIESLVRQLLNQIKNLRIVVGDLTDESVGEEEFNSVQDIDDAKLSVISWLKSIYREQLIGKFIS